MGLRQLIDQAQTAAEFATWLVWERIESGIVWNPLDRRLRADPHSMYRRLRERDPVHRSRLADGFVLSRHADILTVLRDPTWSSDERHYSRYARLRARAARAGISDPYADDRATMLRLDPPDHTRLRGLVSKAFTPRAIEAMRPGIEKRVDALLSSAGARGHMELVSDLASPLPVMVIAEMLGVPPEDHERFRRWSDDAILMLGDNSMEDKRRGLRAIDDLREYFRATAEARRVEPRDDLLSAMVEAEEAGDRLSLPELLGTCVLLLVAGNETTTKLIGNSVLALLRHPEQLALLRAEPERIGPAVEELLRYDGPVQLTSRLAAQDRELLGRPVRRGQQVILLLPAGNRDPEAFSDPDRLDVTRENVRHLAFGHGLHFCLGAQLARLEAAVALEGLVTRFPRLRLADDRISWSRGVVLRGPEELRVRL
jgi:cytochrome P450